MGAVVIYTRRISGLTEKIIWVKSGNKGLSWKREELSIGETNEYQVRVSFTDYIYIYYIILYIT